MEGLLKKKISAHELPLVVEPANQKISLIESFQLLSHHRENLKKNLLISGGLLFRNFPVSNEKDFSNFIKTLGLGNFIDYIGDSPRTKIAEGIYTSTETPSSVKIPLHNELSFIDLYPKHIYFYCHTVPQKGGETILADGRKILHALNDKIKFRFKDKGLKYTSRYHERNIFLKMINKLHPSHRTWVDVFETKDKDEVEHKCRLSNFHFKWNKNNWIQISQQRPATIRHPQTNEEVWFNQAHLFDFNPKLMGLWRFVSSQLLYYPKHTKLHDVSFGDLTSIPREDLYQIMDTLDEHTIKFPWQKGDVLVLDNVLAMHGRATFSGKRRVMAAMTS
ncbi:MAG: TauD/TfdA family dioxygenase [Parachlamydiaceae bacterium]|nr:TauD/TfdA family dioxygenase [Parachlamydiaceae bacterium]